MSDISHIIQTFVSTIIRRLL